MNDQYQDPRRTETYIYNTVQQALQSVVFEPNTPSTWHAVTAMVNQFLNTIWQQGALQGSTAAQAFRVSCGLGSTMTAQDLEAGLLKVVTEVAITYPDEFVVLENEITLSTSS